LIATIRKRARFPEIRTNVAGAMFGAVKRLDINLEHAVGLVTRKFWTFGWEFYCQQCREYEWCGAVTLLSPCR